MNKDKDKKDLMKLREEGKRIEDNFEVYPYEIMKKILESHIPCVDTKFPKHKEEKVKE